MGLFKKALVFTDIHFGMKSNSIMHNQDCENFVEWAVQQGKIHNCETAIFMGDWHHHRASINIATMNATIRDLKKLNDNFDKVYFITGNHDLYYREKREIHSIPMADEYPNIRIVNEEIYEEGNCAFIPWLVEDEWTEQLKT